MRRSRRNTPLTTILLLILVAIAYFYFRNNGAPPSNVIIPSTGTNSPGTLAANVAAPQFGHQTKTSGCEVNGKLQDKACTPGDVIPNVTTAEICKSGYASSVRNVTTTEKDQVYAEYGITSHSPGQYEVDHLVSLELGGSNDISNLWPEPASPAPGFHEKDKVENYLHDQVCSGAMSLADAQKQIATDWTVVYNSMQK